MYFGETQIFENRIKHFVNVAKDLELKEICDGQDEDDVTEVPEEEVMAAEVEDDRQNTWSETEEQIIIKKDNEEHKSLNTDGTVSRRRQQNVVNKDGKFSCDQCDYLAGYSSHLNEHKRSKHEGERLYWCDWYWSDY